MLQIEYVVYRALWAGALVPWLKLPAWKVGDRGFEPHSGLQVSKKQCFFPADSQLFNIVESLRDRDVACSASDRQGSNSGSVISFISLYSGGSPDAVQLICAQRWPEIPFI